MISRVTSAVLAVADQDVMVEFFVDQLGFEKRTDAEMWPGARWVEVAPTGAETTVVLNRAADFEREPMTEYPMLFGCRDLAGTVERLRAAGLTVTDPVTESWGSYVRVTDPEGRELMINDLG